MGTKNNESPARQLVKLVWQNKMEGVAHSWQRVNGCMSSAVSLAIESGLKFAEDDVQHFMDDMRGEYWFNVEQLYTLACGYVHASACQSFEAYFKRPPFWSTDASPKRLHVGASLDWEGQCTTVTSFSDDGSYLTACIYHMGDSLEARRKVKKRYRITRDDLRKARKTNKGRAS